MKLLKKQKGQALLIILLVMAVILTIALSIISRSVTDISFSQKDEAGARAYSAAEAGIERALLSGGLVLSGSLPSGDQFSANIVGIATGSKEYIVPLPLSSGETAPVWFVNHDENKEIACSDSLPCSLGSTLKICWGEEGTSSSTDATPALEASFLYTSTDEASSARMARAAYDPNSSRSNNFTKGSDGECTIESKKFAFSKTLDLTSLGITIRDQVKKSKGLQSARIKLLYNTDRTHSVGIIITSSTGVFPRQGSKITSDGTSSGSSRKVEVYQLYPDLSPIFDYGIFSGSGGITK